MKTISDKKLASALLEDSGICSIIEQSPSELHVRQCVARFSAAVCALTLLVFALTSEQAFSQGSIYGLVQSSDLSSPANGELKFFGFLDETDNELRIETTVGAGYDNSNWFDDFQNYLDEAAGQPYRYYFFNTANSEMNLLVGFVPNNSFQQANVQLLPSFAPQKPEAVSAVFSSEGNLSVTWSATDGLGYHIYRRFETAGGSFMRIDNPDGSLSDRGVTTGTFIDTLVSDSNVYEYVLIAEDSTGFYSEHSDIALSATATSCCILAGDGNQNGTVNIADATYLIAYIFTGGTAPSCLDQADTNGNNTVNIADATYLIAYIFTGGSAPVCGTTGS